MKTVMLYGVLMLSFLMLCIPGSKAQEESAIRSILAAGDLKKLEKAEQYKAEAEGLIGEANQLYLEVFSVQSNPELSEKAIAKKVKQLETSARAKQIEASALNEKSNEIKFILYKRYIDDFWEKHENQESLYLEAKMMEEQASDHYFQGVSARLEARKMDDGFAKIEKLNEAHNLESQAIQKQVTALSHYHGLSETVADVSNEADIPDEPTAPADSRVDDGIVAPAVSDSVGMVEVPVSDPAVSISDQDLPSEPAIDSTVQQSIEPAPAELPPEQVEPVEDISPGHASDIEFHVQIAASRRAIPPDELSLIYNGPHPITIVREDGWYKYHLNAGPSHKDADQLRISCNVVGAFLVAYRGTARINIFDAIRISKRSEAF